MLLHFVSTRVSEDKVAGEKANFYKCVKHWNFSYSIPEENGTEDSFNLALNQFLIATKPDFS